MCFCFALFVTSLRAWCLRLFAYLVTQISLLEVVASFCAYLASFMPLKQTTCISLNSKITNSVTVGHIPMFT